MSGAPTLKASGSASSEALPLPGGAVQATAKRTYVETVWSVTKLTCAGDDEPRPVVPQGSTSLPEEPGSASSGDVCSDGGGTDVDSPGELQGHTVMSKCVEGDEPLAPSSCVNASLLEDQSSGHHPLAPPAEDSSVHLGRLSGRSSSLMEAYHFLLGADDYHWEDWSRLNATTEGVLVSVEACGEGQVAPGQADINWETRTDADKPLQLKEEVLAETGEGKELSRASVQKGLGGASICPAHSPPEPTAMRQLEAPRLPGKTQHLRLSRTRAMEGLQSDGQEATPYDLKGGFFRPGSVPPTGRADISLSKAPSWLAQHYVSAAPLHHFNTGALHMNRPGEGGSERGRYSGRDSGFQQHGEAGLGLWQKEEYGRLSLNSPESDEKYCCPSASEGLVQNESWHHEWLGKSHVPVERLHPVSWSNTHEADAVPAGPWNMYPTGPQARAMEYAMPSSDTHASRFLKGSTSREMAFFAGQHPTAIPYQEDRGLVLGQHPAAMFDCKLYCLGTGSPGGPFVGQGPATVSDQEVYCHDVSRPRLPPPGGLNMLPGDLRSYRVCGDSFKQGADGGPSLVPEQIVQDKHQIILSRLVGPVPPRERCRRNQGDGWTMMEHDHQLFMPPASTSSAEVSRLAFTSRTWTGTTPLLTPQVDSGDYSHMTPW